MAAPGMAQGAGVFREGNKLVVTKRTPYVAAELPMQCVKCGKPGKPLKKNFAWHAPWIYLLILAGILIYAIVALIVQKKITFGVPLCDEHAGQRKRKILIAWLLVVAGIASLFVVAALPSTMNIDVVWGIFAFMALLIAGTVVGVQASPLRPTFIDDTRGVFTGAGEAFLQQFPDIASTGQR